jgi:hypothetical protein
MAPGNGAFQTKIWATIYIRINQVVTATLMLISDESKVFFMVVNLDGG